MLLSANPLHSLNALRAFEATARSGSFTRAAQELNSSQAAVSSIVRVLEKRLGFALFERSANQLILTEQGEKLQPGLSAALKSISDLVDEVAAMSAKRRLTLGIASTFAIRWLIPRLGNFRRAHPDIDIQIAIGDCGAAFAPEWTCCIRFGTKSDECYAVERLFDAELVPVCSPDVAARITCAADLANETILQVSSELEDWNVWLAAASLSALAPKLVFTSYLMVIQAALNGMGVAMVPLPYVDAELNSGRLVTPISLKVSKGRPWTLVYKPSRMNSPEFMLFRHWLLEEAGRPQELLDRCGPAVSAIPPAKKGVRRALSSAAF